MATSVQGLKLAESDLLCRAGCGFYGNPKWEGYCSKCWREYLPPATAKPTLPKFDKFEEKKRQQNNKASMTISNFMRKSVSRDDSVGSASLKPSSKQKPARSTSPDSSSARARYHTWLKQRTPKEAQFLQKSLHDVVIYIEHLPVTQLADRAQALYAVVESKTDREAAEELEHYICTRFHRYLFAQAEDESVDLALQSRIRSLNWVIQGVLDSGLKPRIDGVRESINGAISRVIEMTSKKSPNEKLSCIVLCSKSLMTALGLSTGGPGSADDFLPALIYLLIRVNPPLLQSNINFITRFSVPSRLQAGEQAYYFTNLCCAVSFIQNLNASHLRITENEFAAYMDGKVPPGSKDAEFEPLEGALTLRDKLFVIQASQKDLISQMRAYSEAKTEQFNSMMSQMKNMRETQPLRLWEPEKFDLREEVRKAHSIQAARTE